MVLKKRYHGLIPITRWLPEYNKNCLKNDIIAGLTVGMMTIPQAMVYAAVAGLPLEYGLYSSIMPLIVYAIFGSSKDISVGVTAVLSSMTYEVCHGNVINSIIICCLSGVVQVLVGLLHIGFVSCFISLPVLHAFVSAAAITISTGQIKNIVGFSMRSPFLEAYYDLFTKMNQVRPGDLIMGICCILALLYMSHWKNKLKKRKDSGIMFVILCLRNVFIVIIATIISYILSPHNQSLDVDAGPFIIVGYVPSGMAPFSVPKLTLSKISELAISAVMVAFIAFIECYSIGKAYAIENNYTDVYDPNQELIAVGLGNILGSFFSSFPVTGSFSRTAVNSDAGSKTPMSSIFSCLAVIIAVSFLTSMFYYIPQAALAAIIINAVLPMVDISIIKDFMKKGRTVWVDIVAYTITLPFCIFYSLEYGVLIGAGVHICLTMYIQAVPGTDLINISTNLGDVLLFRMNGPISFASAEYLLSTLQEAQDLCYDQTGKGLSIGLPVWKGAPSSPVKDISYLNDMEVVHGPMRGLILDMSCVPYIDTTGLDAIHQVLSFFHKRSSPVPVHFVCTHRQVEATLLQSVARLRRSLVGESQKSKYFHHTTEEAMTHIQQDIAEVESGDWSSEAFDENKEEGFWGDMNESLLGNQTYVSVSDGDDNDDGDEL